MREYREYLSERELYVLENHPRLTYKMIGEELGISQERVRQLKVHAERMIREERRREQVQANGRLPVQLTLQRRDVYLIIEALREYHTTLLKRKADQRFKNEDEKEKEPDLWFQRLEEIEKLLQDGYYSKPFLSVITTYGAMSKEE